eukprot:SAG31_NODE_722_length_12572_cov_2.409124_13_plen_97_part_00
MNGQRLSVAETEGIGLPKDWQQLIEYCWLEAEKRPTFSECQQRLGAMQRELMMQTRDAATLSAPSLASDQHTLERDVSAAVSPPAAPTSVGVPAQQ